MVGNGMAGGIAVVSADRRVRDFSLMLVVGNGGTPLPCQQLRGSPRAGSMNRRDCDFSLTVVEIVLQLTRFAAGGLSLATVT